jgi:hypothetical protein
MIRRLTAAATVAVSLLGAGAFAQTPPVVPPVAPSADGAARLRALIEAHWDRIDASLPDGIVITRSGEVSVVPTGAVYRIRMPQTTLGLMGEAVIDLGILEGIARPGPDDTLDLSAPMPGLIGVRDGAGAAVGEIRIGGGEARLVYSMRDGQVISSMAETHDIALTVIGDDTKSFAIGRIALEERSGPVVGARRDDESRIAFEDIEFTDTQTDTFVAVGRIEARGRNKGLNRSAVDALNTGFTAFARAADRGEADPGRLLPLLPLLRDVADAIEVTVELADLAVVAPDGTAFELGRIAYGFALSGLRSGASRVELGFSMSDPAFDGVPLPAEAIPTRIALRLALDRIPNAVIGDAMQDLLERAANGEDPGEAAPMLGLGLLGAFTQAGTELRIEEATLSAPDYGIAADGAARLDPASPVMATATLGVTLSGLDKVGTIVEGLDALSARERGDARAVLSLIQALGQPATDAAGRPARRYQFAVEPTGRLSLNGADLQPILDTMMRTIR